MKRMSKLLIGIISIILGVLLVVFSTGCTAPGTLETVSSPNHDIELYRYYYGSAGNYVFISKFKECDKIKTVTWQSGKIHQSNIIFENDEIILKKKEK